MTFKAGGLGYVKCKTPTLVVLENVADLAKVRKVDGKAGRGVDIITADLTRLGYKVVWVQLTSSDYGLCQRRYRIYVVAVLNQDPDVCHKIVQLIGDLRVQGPKLSLMLGPSA